MSQGSQEVLRLLDKVNAYSTPKAKAIRDIS